MFTHVASLRHIDKLYKYFKRTPCQLGRKKSFRKGPNSHYRNRRKLRYEDVINAYFYPSFGISTYGIFTKQNERFEHSDFYGCLYNSFLARSDLNYDISEKGEQKHFLSVIHYTR